MKKKKVDYMPYISIIAIVAIVAVVLLVLNKGNLAGEAVYPRPVPTPSVSTSSQTVVFVSADDIKNFYVHSFYTGEYEKEKTGNEICREMSYRGCLTTEVSFASTSYATNDQSCSGNIQSTYKYASFVNCQYRPNEQVSQCVKLSGTGLTQPLSGDNKDSVDGITNIICIK